MDHEPAGRPSVPLLVVVLTVLCDLALAWMFLSNGPLLLDFLALRPRCTPPGQFAGVSLAVAVLHLAAAGGVLASRRWGRYLQVAACSIDVLLPWWPALSLGSLAIPLVFWTVPAALVGAYWLLRPQTTLLAAAMRPSLIVLTLAAGLMTGELRPHGPAWSALALGDLRALAAAEEAYRQASGGFYGSPECLADPRKCLPALTAALDKPFLNPSDIGRFSGVRSRFRRAFHSGRAATDTSVPGSRLTSFAVTAAPTALDGKSWSGCYGFCLDSTSTICAAPLGAPAVTDGHCDMSTCRKLE